MPDTALTRGLPWRWSARGIWLGPLAFAVSLPGVVVCDRGRRAQARRTRLGDGQGVGRIPMPAHWTPAFPAFYAAIAVPIRAWVGSAGGMAARKAEMDNDRRRCRGTRHIRVREYSLLLLQVLREPGEFEKRAL